MGSARGLAPAAGCALVLALVSVLPSPHQTRAGWREDANASLPDGRTDGFALTSQNVTTTVDHRQSAPTDVANEPGIRVQNDATRHQSWIDVVSTTITVPASNTTSTLLTKVNIDYDVNSTCESGLATPYWNVNDAGVGGLQAGVTYSRTSAKVAGDVLPPGQATSVCPWVQPDYPTATADGRRDLLLAHAGRQLDIATVVRQRSEAPGTWSSPGQTVTTRYQVKLPPPTRPSSDGIVCSRTLVDGTRSSVGTFGRLYWAWPFAAQSVDIATAAVDRFVLLRSTDGQTWTEFRKSLTQDPAASRYQVSGGVRASEVINSDHLANNAPTPVYLSVRAYLYSGSSVYVDADWMVQASEGDAAVDDHFACRTGGLQTETSGGVTNPGSAPNGL